MAGEKNADRNSRQLKLKGKIGAGLVTKKKAPTSPYFLYCSSFIKQSPDRKGGDIAPMVSQGLIVERI